MGRSIYYASVLVLLYLSSVVHSFVLEFSEPEQCGSVRVAWTQRSDPAEQYQYPFNLYIIPFNSTAIVDEIDDWNASTPSGSALLDFPLPAFTPYILGVVDAQGRGVGPSSQIRTARDSNHTSCLPSQSPQVAQVQAYSASLSSECPTIELSFDPLSQPPRALSFSPGQFPFKQTTTSFQSGLMRISGFTSLSQVVVVYQANKSAPAYTSSLINVGGSDSINCGNSLIGVHTRPAALRGGSVIGYVLAAVVVTAVVTTFAVYIQNIRISALRSPCPPPKDHFILTRRPSKFPQETDLEAARFIPLPPSTGSLTNLSEVIGDSVVSLAVPDAPHSTPVSRRLTPSDFGNIHGAVHPTVPNQQSMAEPVINTPINNHLNTPSAGHLPVAKEASEPPQKTRQRQSDVSSLHLQPTRPQSNVSSYLHSTRPSTFISSTRGSITLDAFGETAMPHFAPRPDSPTLPEIPLSSPFHLSLELRRSSKASSSKKSEKRSLYTKMENVDEVPAGSSSNRRARSLTRKKSSSSRKSRGKAQSLPR